MHQAARRYCFPSWSQGRRLGPSLECGCRRCEGAQLPSQRHLRYRPSAAAAAAIAAVAAAAARSHLLGAASCLAAARSHLLGAASCLAAAAAAVP